MIKNDFFSLAALINQLDNNSRNINSTSSWSLGQPPGNIWIFFWGLLLKPDSKRQPKIRFRNCVIFLIFWFSISFDSTFLGHCRHYILITSAELYWVDPKRFHRPNTGQSMFYLTLILIIKYSSNHQMETNLVVPSLGFV